MKKPLSWIAALSLAAPPCLADEPLPHLDLKTAAVSAVNARGEQLVRLADTVWEYAELALSERRSADLLARHLETEGFAVERGVAELPTAFVASYGSGRPVLGILGEYDALPGISQKALPRQEPLVEGAAGHGCGHNLLGVGALGAALAVKDLLESGRLEGTVRFYGSPAEERVGGKIYMARAGLFDDLDAVITWHPDHLTRADTAGSQAMLDLVAEFRGRASHAAFDPWNGRSALDGAELFLHGLNRLREHVRPTVRIHYVIPDGGGVPNVVPETASVWVWVRDSRMASVEELLKRVRDVAEGAALATGTRAEVRIQTGSWEMLPSLSGARRLHANLAWLGPASFDADDAAFAGALKAASGVPAVGMDADLQPLDETPGDPDGGSTDVADVSWLVPTIHLSATTAPAGVTWHAWPVVASSRTPIGHKGMLLAARALAATAVDLFLDSDLRRAMREELAERTAGQAWKAWIPPGPPPPPGEETAH